MGSRLPAAPRRADWEPFGFQGRSFLATTLPGHEPLARRRFLVPASIADRYLVRSLLAIGEATVLLDAHDGRTRASVLVKALRTAAIADFAEPPPASDTLRYQLRRARHWLQTERRLLVRLRNAGCVAVPHVNDYVYDQNPLISELVASSPEPHDGLVGSEPYLVLERLSGLSLEQLLESQQPHGMDERRAIELILPVLEVLALLQEPWHVASGRTWHCVYQDLKPANILVDRFGRPTLVDFGGCQVVVDGVPVLEGARTPGYAAPECAQPGRVLLPCADVYSVGATLFQMLTGIAPSVSGRGSGAGGPAASIDLAALERSCSPATAAMVRKCLSERPSDRFSNVLQVVEAARSLSAPPQPRYVKNLTPAP
jgi:serine/threonine protein kinase